MRIVTLLAVSALSIGVAAPAFAQDAMKSDSMMKMSAKDTMKMDHCNAMTHDMMMKMHPDMMKHDDSMMAH